MTTRMLPDRIDEDQPSLYQTQRNFCEYLRNPDSHPAPEGLNIRRLNVYRDLIFKNIESLLAGAFPVIKSVVGLHWPALIREFLVDYQSSTPFFTQLANEFYQFLCQREGRENEPEFLVELAQHELIELELIYRHKQHSPKPDYTDNASLNKTLFADLPLHLSSLALVAQYRFPVHQISKQNIPQTVPETPTYLLAYRDEANSVRFVQLSELAFQLLKLIEANPGYSAEVWLESLKAHLAHARDGMPGDFDGKQFSNNGLHLLENFFNGGILYTLAISQESHD